MTIKIWGWVFLLGGILAVTTTGCSDDTPSGDQGSKTDAPRLLKSMAKGSNPADGYEYDAKGRLIKVVGRLSGGKDFPASTCTDTYDYSPTVGWEDMGPCDMFMHEYMDFDTPCYDFSNTFDVYAYANSDGQAEVVIGARYADFRPEDKHLFHYQLGYADGRLLTMKEIYDGHVYPYYQFTYDKAGDIVQVNDVGGPKPVEIYYTNEAHPQPIDNVGGLMLYNRTFGLSMWDGCLLTLEAAKMTGKATAHLPLGWKATRTLTGEPVEEECTLDWTLNEEGYPTDLVHVVRAKGRVQENNHFKFTWE